MNPAKGSIPQPLTGIFLKNTRKKFRLFLLLLLFTGVLAAWALTQGAYSVSFNDLALALSGGSNQPAGIIIMNLRLPRIIAALIAGWGLSMAGLALQSLLKNPLASPSTLGISQGAAFGAALSIMLFSGQVMSITVFAFVGAMGATMIILILARLRALSPEAVILAGVALSALFTSATSLMQYLATDTQLALVVFWTFGDVARSGRQEIILLACTIAVVSLFFQFRRWDLNALASGEESARGLGVNVDQIRIQGMIAAALVAAMVTAFHGIIAFIGLLAPHIARRIVGANHQILLPFSSVVGAFLLLAADTMGRVLLGSGSLPVGVITSFMGAPLFLYLLVRGYR